MTAVSVVLASFRSAYVESAIASVVAQTAQDWELLVVDDDPARGAGPVIRAFDDRRIRYLPNSTRLGPALNHQRGFDEASFDFVAIINHDDEWEPHLLMTLSGAMKDWSSISPSVAFSDHWVVDADGHIDHGATEECSRAYGRSQLTPGPYTGDTLFRLAVVTRSIPVAQSALMSRRDVPRIPPWVGGAYDFFIACQLAALAKPAVYVDERLARFRLHSSNLGLSRSPRRDLVAAALYLKVASKAPPDVRDHCRLQAARAVATTPRSTVRLLQHRILPRVRSRFSASNGSGRDG